MLDEAYIRSNSGSNIEHDASEKVCLPCSKYNCRNVGVVVIVLAHIAIMLQLLVPRYVLTEKLIKPIRFDVIINQSY